MSKSQVKVLAWLINSCNWRSAVAQPVGNWDSFRAVLKCPWARLGTPKLLRTFVQDSRLTPTPLSPWMCVMWNKRESVKTSSLLLGLIRTLPPSLTASVLSSNLWFWICQKIGMCFISGWHGDEQSCERCVRSCKCGQFCVFRFQISLSDCADLFH